MSKEPLYSSADKERLLQELETVTTTGTRVPVIQDAENVEALHELFGQVVGLPKEVDAAPEPPKEKGPKMTSTQLQAMKGTAASKKVSGSGGLQPVFQGLIMCWCAVTGFFSDRKNKGAEACAQKRASKDPKSRK